ncbi:threonine aldolase family protein [Actinoplanes awajinensis]|uniref:Threonine aldolase n=1 Tax=Actinoplanes awajinensis subsp. mycoplanecinus TaxID=135947 RepID=A0A0X3VFK5_9ACTN|nr:beta-eliminating lyase-related protein [Actinoplanes awajinensis]KUL42176.1 threonine aldolase [Actinoplanes awajinensis subsp. mycoplanecinus]
MADDVRVRRIAAMRGCDRILDGVRPKSLRERLAELSEAAGPELMPDYYGDGLVGELEDRVAGLLGAEAAVFFPTGTMAQQVAIRYGADLTGRSTVALHPLGHQEMHERRAYADLTGLRSVHPTAAPRNPTAAEIAALPEPVGTVVLELPMRDAGFVLPTWAELTEVCEAARGSGARVHLDGARLWESAPYLGHSLAEIAGRADSTYVSFYKTLGGLSGAALTGTTALAAYARLWRHRYGGQLFQQWPAVLSALVGLDRELPRVPEYVRHARTIAAALAQLPGAVVFPQPPHTHQFRLWLPHPAALLNDAGLLLAEEEKVWFTGGWRDTEIPGHAVTEVSVQSPALEWGTDEVIDTGLRLLDRVQN